jgi:sugar phosphate permease
MWLIASLFYAYQYILRVMPNALSFDIMAKYDITPNAFGQLSGVYYIAYAFAHIPVGLLLDRYGPKVIMPMLILLTTIGLMPFVYTDVWVYPILGRALIGIGSSAAILGLFKVVRLSFSEENFARMLGLSVTIGLIGGIYGGGPLYYLKSIFGYDFIITTLIVFGILLALITYLVIPHMPRTLQHFSMYNEVRTVLTNPTVILIALCAGLMAGLLEGFADAWSTNYLKIVYSYDNETASSLSSLIFLGMCFGAPLLTTIADKTKTHFATVSLSGIIMLVSILAILTGSLSQNMIATLFFIIGFLCAYQVIAISQVSRFVPGEMVGFATAIVNGIIMLFGYIFHTLIYLWLKHSATNPRYWYTWLHSLTFS